MKEAYSANTGPNSHDQNAEGLLILNYDWYRFNTTELQTRLQLYPGVSDPGRFRSNLDASYSVKLPHDVNWSISMWEP